MTHQTLINEIQKLYVEKKEKKLDIVSEKLYIFQKYPHIKNLYEEYRGRSEKWHQLVRETLFFDSQSIRYMYDRTMQLIRRIGQNTRLYFTIKTELGTYTLPDRLSDLNRLMELHRIFFCEIFPELSKRITLDVLREEYKSRIVTGKIQWARTINDPSNIAFLKNPLVFTITKPTTRSDIPENILLILSVLRMKYDSMFLLRYSFTDPLSISERRILEGIDEGCSQALRLTLLQGLIPQAKRYVFLKLNDPRILRLESEARSRIREPSPRNALFRRLLEWRRQYRNLQLRIASPHTTCFPLDHIHNIDTMYELWILFEMLDFFRSQGAIVTISRFPREFSIVTDNSKCTLFYEKKYEGWSSVGALPDFTIEVAGEVRVVMDAKNWLLEDKKKAIYKMLGYMNNLDTRLGVLFFPNELKLKEKRVHHGKGLKHHKDQCLFNCVLYPSGLTKDHENKIKQFRELLGLIHACSASPVLT